MALRKYPSREPYRSIRDTQWPGPHEAAPGPDPLVDDTTDTDSGSSGVDAQASSEHSDKSTGLKRIPTGVRKSQIPATTVTQSRAIMFLPVSRTSHLQKLEKDTAHLVFKNAHAEVSIKGRLLTQVHRNILDAIFSYYEPARVHQDGSVSYAFTMHSLLKHLGDVHARNHAWLRDRLDDMMMVVLITKTNDGWTNHSHILSGHRYSEKHANRKGDPLYVVTFDPYFLNYLRHDLHVHTEKLTPQILRLQHAQTQALVRYLLSHTETNISLEEVLYTIGVFRDDVSDRGKRFLLSCILDEREVLEKEFGITFRKMSNGKWGVFYKQHNTVWFEKPSKEKLGLPDPET